MVRATPTKAISKSQRSRHCSSDERAARYAAADEAEAKAKADKKSDADVAKAMADALHPYGRRVRDDRTGRVDELRGHAALAAGDPADAKPQFEKLKDEKSVRKDHLARDLSLAGDHAQAETLARKAVEDGPGEVYPLASLVDVLAAGRQKAEAKAEFAKLRSLAAVRRSWTIPCSNGCRRSPAELNLPADWRVRASRRPTSACDPTWPAWARFAGSPRRPRVGRWPAPTADTVSLDEYRGKPVVVIFYLGLRLSALCRAAPQVRAADQPVCRRGHFAGRHQQRTARHAQGFAGQARRRRNRSRFRWRPTQTWPCSRAIGPMTTSRRCRCTRTYLIDAEGLVRWHDISYEPFTDADFLLDEAKRLLGR